VAAPVRACGKATKKMGFSELEQFSPKLTRTAKKQVRYCVPAFLAAPVRLELTTHGLTGCPNEFFGLKS
jgi:hypothetical protein